MRRIICIGNRHAEGDDAGMRVYDSLKNMELPGDVELIEGGIAGLNLLPFLEDSERVTFVDQVAGFEPAEKIVTLSFEEVAGLADEQYGHGAGIPYLLRILPQVCDRSIPVIDLVGIEGFPDEETVKKASLLAVQRSGQHRQIH